MKWVLPNMGPLKLLYLKFASCLSNSARRWETRIMSLSVVVADVRCGRRTRRPQSSQSMCSFAVWTFAKITFDLKNNRVDSSQCDVETEKIPQSEMWGKKIFLCKLLARRKRFWCEKVKNVLYFLFCLDVKWNFTGTFTRVVDNQLVSVKTKFLSFGILKKFVVVSFTQHV